MNFLSYIRKRTTPFRENCSLFSAGGEGLVVTQVLGPEWVEVGGEAILECQYRLERETLYSIKWYQRDDEFYRYIPSKIRPLHAFPNDFIHVDVS